ncbi:ABC transporter permease/M1 family aminopeptidase [Chitinophaga japonensis]|uniref:ABC-2 family transporter n=1 Tax=Chitinophaga japonensis TaxID=104662 RepID=A0A562T0G7_CHIJA|nr:M1 family aminopeptidase [Chitinophaga japonensis]TWI86798.1 ABC-2 family transporter [Chitinophaga japonensis]
MKHIFLFDLQCYLRRAGFYIGGLFLLAAGIFAGLQFNLSAGDGIYLNSPYSVGFTSGMLSLSLIFIATLFTVQLLSRESDSGFAAIMYTLPLKRRQWVWGRLLSVITLSLAGFVLIMLGFAAGQLLRSGQEMRPGFRLLHYVYPLLVFGLVNGLFVCSVLCAVGWYSGNKLVVSVTGILLYMLYMISLLFSNSPFMAQSLPQSAAAQQVSAIADPFGLSAYFLSSQEFTVAQRNQSIVPLQSFFLVNRLLVLAVSAALFLLAGRAFSLSEKRRRHRKTGRPADNRPAPAALTPGYFTTAVKAGTTGGMRALLSFVKLDLVYAFKSIPLVMAAVALLFYTGMEMYAAIEKGVRMPQQYASSGLMAVTISGNFHLPGVFLLAYFANDLYWRSSASRFALVEKTTRFAGAKALAHWISSSLLALGFTLLLVAAGILFQLAYRYPHFDAAAYGGAVLFNTGPLVLTAGLLILVNAVAGNRYAALGISLVFVLLTASPLARKILPFPLLRFQGGYPGVYSDFNGYGIYLSSFAKRLLCGFCFVSALWLLKRITGTHKLRFSTCLALAAVTLAGAYAGRAFLDGYEPGRKEARLAAAIAYEKQYRSWQHRPQPVVTDVQATVQLFPQRRAYTIEGHYTLQNKTRTAVDSILLNFNEDLRLIKAGLLYDSACLPISRHVTAIRLPRPLQPGDTAGLRFTVSCQWAAVNGHDPFNAILGNGSFMRISRYFPQPGYLAGREITDKNIRRQYRLGAATTEKKLDAPKSPASDFTHLDMTISTDSGQTAIGVGELVEQWQQRGRHYFRYKTPEPIPFRFAIASAAYKTRELRHNGIRIQVYYCPTHAENVAHLLRNARLALDYCVQQFGPYPYRSLRFAEVSSFTRGFAATAYPASIFMTEDMTFHANIRADQQQDVINELAGHELSHLWWGNNQVAPDEREGATMLTETLAMYTELMLYKKMYGRARTLDRVRLHRQIYAAEKGFAAAQPLYKVTAENRHISYSKGAVAMYLLSEAAGEQQLNLALRRFLQQHRYPAPPPDSRDLLQAFYAATPAALHGKIDAWFKGTGPLD